MEQAKDLAQKFMSGGAGGQEVPAGDKQAGGTGSSGLMNMATSYLGGEHGHQQAATGATTGDTGGLKGMASQFLGGQSAGAEGDSGGSAKMMLGAAQAMMGGGSGHAVGGATGEGGAGSMDAGLVDKLLTVFQQKEGKQFGGTEGEFDQLTSMAHSMLGTPVGRDLLKMWVKQRLGM